MKNKKDNWLMVMYATETQDFTPYVNEVMAIDDITMGNTKDPYLVRYRGRIRGDSAEAYDRLATRLRPQGITPLFRKDHDTQVVLLIDGVLETKPSNPVVNLVLFILTLVSVIFAGSLNTFTGPANTAGEYILGLLRNMPNGLPFAAALLAILLAHEFGHYLAGRFHKTNVTLPYFIPLPISPFGTLGAFIQLKEPPKNRRILLDIGIAGPLAGLMVAIPVLLLGLALSKVEMLSPIPGQGVQMEGNSILYLLAKLVVFGQFLPHPASYGNMSPVLYWIRYFFTGQPFPWGGMDVVIHPIAFAGWAGLLVTALNLIPAGQLDGGHVLYVLLGHKARAFLPVILVALVLLGFVWIGWWLWAFLIFLLGRLYAEPLDQITPLDSPRKAIAILGLVIFFLVFTPIPLIAVMAG
jgi:membrane-associated protease RseP (regulator of RpoE activity)